MDQNRKLSLKSFRFVFFFMSGAYLVFALAAWSQPLFPTIGVCASMFFTFCGFHAWWRVKKLAKKGEQVPKEERGLIIIEPEVLPPDNLTDQ